MKKGVIKGLLASTLMLMVIDVEAVVVSVVPSHQYANPGDVITTDIFIEDLAAGGAPSLSEFDIDLTFDPSILAIDTADVNQDHVIDSVTLDPTGQLDLFGLGLNSVFAGLTSNSTLNLFDLSFDQPSDLDSMQADSFQLASIDFTVLATGISSIGIALNTLGDSQGLPLTANIENGSVTVTASPVPEIPLFWLLLSGLTAIATRKVRKIQWL